MFSSAIYVAFFFVGMLFVVDAYPGKREGCSGSYLKLGCFNDKHARGLRPMPDLLFTDLDQTSNNFSGVQVDWENWDTYMKDVVCRCAKKAKAEGYMVFGLQYYGECWAAKGNLLVNVNGLSDQCVTNNMEDCQFNSKVCVGRRYDSIYAYSVVKSRFGK